MKQPLPNLVENTLTTQTEYIKVFMRTKNDKVRSKHHSRCFLQIVIDLYSCIPWTSVGYNSSLVTTLQEDRQVDTGIDFIH